MPGVKGSGGPVPKRADQRHGHRSKDEAKPEQVVDPYEITIPAPGESWHPVARLWFESLERSGQSVFYTNSDWGIAYVLAESISREMNPQPIAVGKGEHAHVEMVELPPKGASLSAWLKGMAALLVTEGDRRRLRLELERASDSAERREPAGVTDLRSWKESLNA